MVRPTGSIRIGVIHRKIQTLMSDSKLRHFSTVRKAIGSLARRKDVTKGSIESLRKTLAEKELEIRAAQNAGLKRPFVEERGPGGQRILREAWSKPHRPK
ncbi:MAG TPA: hypothetical protein VJG83_06860 [archaeon]|nr:hypothetical protein [archaeon]